MTPNFAAPCQEDALLRDVVFVGAQHGWAAGDRGVIWHTADGGRTWQRQRSGIGESLHSLCFLDENHGWAAGGATDPHTLVSRGVLLSTRDGGLTWRVETNLLLPALRRVKFATLNQGWAIGDSSALHPSGVFYTNDGGKKWTPLPLAAPEGNGEKPGFLGEAGLLTGAEPPTWLAGDFVDPLTGALAGRRGLVANIRNRALQASGGPRFGVRGLRRMQLLADGHGWLVGEGGLILATADAGLSWQVPPGGLPSRAAEFFDLQALAAAGQHCWVAGSPGTCVFHSPDGGRSWQPLPTGQSLPIHGLHFSDEQHGCAVGALGLILATTDGGRSWRVERSGGTRAAMLGLLADAEAVPLELFAQLCGNDGYLGAVEVLCRRDLDQGPAARQSTAERTHEALISVGGCAAGGAWQFPLRQPGVATRSEQLLDGWNRANDGRGLARLQEYLVRQIRTWRPEIIVTHAAAPQGDDPLASVIHQAVLQAAQGAGDAAQFSWLVNEAGLAPWKVKKVVGLVPSGSVGEIAWSATQWAPTLGRSPAEAAMPARALVAEGEAAPRTSLNFQMALNTLPSDGGRDPFFGGITLPPGGEARRAMPDVAPDLEALRRSAEKHRNVRAIFERAFVEHAQAEAGGGSQLLAQLGGLTSELTPDAAGQMLFELALRYHRTGQTELAADTLEVLVERHPQHPLTGAAQLSLLQYWSSGEAAWRLQAAQRSAVQPASTLQPARSPTSSEKPGFSPVGFSPVLDGTRRVDRPAKAAQIGKQIERTFPALFAEPRVRFPLAVAQIQQGFPREAERFYLAQRRGRPGDPWQRLATGEEWLGTRQTQPPVSVMKCPRVAAKPYLDGKLDDPAWRSVPPQELHSRVDDAKAWRASVQLAYDDEYLYVAAMCQRPPGAKPANAAGYGTRSVPTTLADDGAGSQLRDGKFPQSLDSLGKPNPKQGGGFPRDAKLPSPSSKPPRNFVTTSTPDSAMPPTGRPRDADLSQHDRLELLLDLDRDYVTYYRLAADERGWTADACLGDPTWNPEWFVASGGDDRAWTIEAAIPLRELTGTSPGTRTAWAIGIQRTVPGVGFQSWSAPASTSIQPEGFGYLLFE